MCRDDYVALHTHKLKQGLNEAEPLRPTPGPGYGVDENKAFAADSSC